jgi:uncharacterized protein
VGNLAKHGIDFRDAGRTFAGLVTTYPSPRYGEERWVTIGLLHGRLVAVAWIARGEVIRIISIRRARDGKTRTYRAVHG